MCNQNNKIQVTGRQTFKNNFIENMKNYKKQITQLLDEYNVSYFHNYEVGDYSVDMYIPILNIGISFYKRNIYEVNYITTMIQCQYYIVVDDYSFEKAICKLMVEMINSIHSIHLANEISNAESDVEKTLVMNNYYRYVILPMERIAELQKRIIDLDGNTDIQDDCNNDYKENTSTISLLRFHNKKFKVVIDKNKINNMTVYDGDNIEELQKITRTNKYMGYIYVLEWDDMVKIGYTTNPVQRYNDLKHHAESYSNVHIGKIAVSREHTNYQINECKLHQYFKRYRKNGTELFALTMQQVIDEIPNCLSFLNESKRIKEMNKQSVDATIQYWDWEKYQ